ncbi:MAG TPA: nucleoside deaminase, partial [Vampirovibrionales bacterium]
MPDNQKNRFIKKAIEIANQNIENGGGPFGALVVKDGQVIAEGRNKVTNNNDPTAHAEVIAIRNACKVLNTFQLTGCEIYSSCEPCPMCFAAIYWARPKAVYYAATKYDAAQAGFDDEFIYKELELKEAE